MNDRILLMLIDDEPQMRDELALLLRAVGNYEVMAFPGAQEALAYLGSCGEGMPAMIVSDISMPDMDGYDFGKALRNDHRCRHVPLLFLTARTAIKDRIDVRRLTPHYFAKDGDRRELLSMIQSILEEHLVQVGVNPLTRLPGNALIESSVNRVVETGERYLVLYMDYDNFKAYNDAYGTHAGDKAIQEGAIAMDRALRLASPVTYFLGHVGGDDFVAVLWGAGDPESVCRAVFEEIDKTRSILYAPEDVARGYFEARNRQGALERYQLLSISIGVLSSDVYRVSGWSEASNRLVSVKCKAKSVPGNSFCIDQRST